LELGIFKSENGLRLSLYLSKPDRRIQRIYCCVWVYCIAHIEVLLARDATQSVMVYLGYVVSHSVGLSVTLVDCDHIRISRNFSKIIPRLLTLRCSLFADPNITDLLQGETYTPKFTCTKM